jgi:hypothetical protein
MFPVWGGNRYSVRYMPGSAVHNGVLMNNPTGEKKRLDAFGGDLYPKAEV